ncbi:hypothetical protein HJG60_010289 [Phyllostomus discolor]|uniref:Uncharacterized protein n=1 Tax=Phyllostomus discolor TaxID=89673 RepID=A0A834AZ35_9CHIR|nr:hypothetical protein HJG60_010289 [Phyllostomus discolor]
MTTCYSITQVDIPYLFSHFPVYGLLGCFQVGFMLVYLIAIKNSTPLLFYILKTAKNHPQCDFSFSLKAKVGTASVGGVTKGEDPTLFLPADHLLPISYLSSVHNRQKESSLCWECSSLPPCHLGNFSSCRSHSHFISPRPHPSTQRK